jgi:hypothetical protein
MESDVIAESGDILRLRQQIPADWIDSISFISVFNNKTWMETNLDGQTTLSSYLDMKSNSVSTPYSTPYSNSSTIETLWGVKDYRAGKHVIEDRHQNYLQEREGNPWTHSGILRRGSRKNRKFIQPNRMEA